MDTTIEREAQTTLAQLLERVAQGERITITENGVPVAVMNSAEPASSTRNSDRQREIRQAIEDIKELRKGLTLGPDLTIRDLIEEGRR
nr:Phd [uncultured bacterium]